LVPRTYHCLQRLFFSCLCLPRAPSPTSRSYLTSPHLVLTTGFARGSPRITAVGLRLCCSLWILHCLPIPHSACLAFLPGWVSLDSYTLAARVCSALTPLVRWLPRTRTTASPATPATSVHYGLLQFFWILPPQFSVHTCLGLYYPLPSLLTCLFSLPGSACLLTPHCTSCLA